MYKHNNGELAEVTKEYELEMIDPEEGYYMSREQIFIYNDMSRIVYKNPVTGQHSSVRLRKDGAPKHPSEWDWDLTNGKLSLKQSVLAHPSNEEGNYHFYLRDNKFYPCSMCSYSQYDAIGNKGWDGKPINDKEA